MHEKYQKFLITDFVVFDIETTGLDPVNHEIVEIAACRVRNGEIVERFEALIAPTKGVPREVEKIHGLNEIFLLVNGQEARKAMTNFVKFVGDNIVVGHNIRDFDWLFVTNHLKRLSLGIMQNKMIDTLELTRKLLRLPKNNLGEVAKYFGYEPKVAHRAMADVETNALVFVKLMELLLNSESTN